MERLSFKTTHTTSKIAQTAAAAHMSLHLPTMRKNRKTSLPQDRSSGDRVIDREVGGCRVEPSRRRRWRGFYERDPDRSTAKITNFRQRVLGPIFRAFAPLPISQIGRGGGESSGLVICSIENQTGQPLERAPFLQLI